MNTTTMMKMMQPLLPREKRVRIWVLALLCFLFLMLAAPKVPHSPKFHRFADMRNFLGVPNTLNVISNFPFLVVGVLGLVLCLRGNFFAISLRGEVWGWAFFYAGTVAVAFGSAYYHLKPDDNRVVWDRLPMMIAYSSLLSIFVVERVGERIGVSCLFSLVMLALISIAYERSFDDLRLCMMFQLIPSIAIPALAFLFPPKYTHSRYWFWAAGLYLLATFEDVADRKIYGFNHYIISGHSLEHLCLVMVPVLLSIMLMYRSIRIPRLGELKERP
ncbi:Ceramidase [Macleaya cordata]|uniref:Ceramidase n=1 Tax=Macleaya cordata TaxID=56857 RepID=A0A200QDD0_MACCD|nr:Ceramidase [Macleaya cordata]